MTNLGDASVLDQPTRTQSDDGSDAGGRRRHGVALAVAIGIAVVLAVVALAQQVLLTGSEGGEHSREGETLTTQVTALSSSGRSLCIERAGSQDTCGVPIALPDSKGQLTPGATVTVTELWLTTNGVTKLAWMVH